LSDPSTPLGASAPHSVPHGPVHVPHHPALQHHFDDLEQQAEASTLGMWLFLVTEIMFFGGLFLAYLLYRLWHPDAFREGSHHLDIQLGAINTAVLILSSLTMALAVRAAQIGRRMGTVYLLIATMVLGCVFLGIKAVEYGDKFEHHLVPGPHFFVDSPHAPAIEMFYSLYFAMTGLHALHMVIGVGVMLVITWMAYRGKFSPEYYVPVEVSGLYWHFVDIVWIFLFPLLYLIGRN
jgi:cytochrome c oxidase subunit 3